MAQVKTPTTLQTLPQELLDKVLWNCYSTTDVASTDDGYVAPQVLGNLRQTNKYMRNASNDAFLKQNFTCFTIKLESYWPRITNNYGALDVALHMLRHFIKETGSESSEKARDFKLEHKVKTIRLLHPQVTASGGLTQGMPQYDLISLEAQLFTLFQMTPYVETLWMDLRPALPLPLHTNPAFDAPLRVLDLQYFLSRQPTSSRFTYIKHIKLYSGHYDFNVFRNFMTSHASTLESLEIFNVELLAGHASLNSTWGILLSFWRDHCAALKDIRFRHLSCWSNTASQRLHGWIASKTEEFVNTAMPEEKQSCMLTSTHRGELGNCGMVGKYGVKVGLNYLLETSSNPRFDPRLELDALIEAGTLKRK